MDTDEKVTFLYHLCDGSSPKSYGVNVARLAGLPPEVLALAVQQSKTFLTKTEGEEAGREDKAASDLAWSKHVHAIRQRYFDTIVSLVSSAMTPEELLALTAELWGRCTHDLSLSNAPK
jgi:DNA mismatch repair ATPase MutS